MLHDLMKVLVAEGHDCSAVMIGQKEIKVREVDGVSIHLQRAENIGSLAREADLLITHLGGTGAALKARRLYGKPLVQLIHNTSEYTIGFLGAGCELAIYNSLWIADHHAKKSDSQLVKVWQGMNRSTVQKRSQMVWPSIVVRPPTQGPFLGGASPSGSISLINLTPNKGPEIFYDLAHMNPSMQFLGTVGGYEESKHDIRQMMNVRHHPHTDDMDDIYRQTSVLIMPSIYESYGRVAVEAMRYGIPVIGSNTPGLSECLDGRTHERTSEAFNRALHEVLDDYEIRSSIAAHRYKELEKQTKTDLQVFASKIKELA